jgi:hypothetical protein
MIGRPARRFRVPIPEVSSMQPRKFGIGCRCDAAPDEAAN